MAKLPVIALKRIRNLTRLLTAPTAHKIRRVGFAVTGRCNSRCSMCDIWRKPRRRRPELTLAQIAALFDGHLFDHLDEITLTGGEPFLRPDIEDLYVYIRRRFPHTAITFVSNAIETVDIFGGREDDHPWTTIMFSLDGEADTHDRIRGVPGNHRRVLESVEYYRGRHPRVRLGLGFTVMPENHTEMRRVYDLSRELGAMFTMRVVVSGAGRYGHAKHGDGFTREMLDEVERDAHSIVTDLARSRGALQRRLNPDLTYFSRMVDYERRPRRMFQCYSGTHSVQLNSYGDVFPCIVRETPLGNVTETPFEDIWFSRDARECRRSIAAEECHCWTECEALPSLQRNFQLLKRRRLN
jgi:MoaA/NifB/PqqE/SkfB family radical SAM enzyme